MNFLYANDENGRYPRSWYTATTDTDQPRPPLRGDVQADVCIIGAGYTGLSAALHLAHLGFDVVVCDAHRVGFGASGRNGGQVGAGFNTPQKYLEKRLGQDAARSLWDMTQDAKALVKTLCAEYAPDAGYTPGIARADFQTSDLAETHADVDYLAQHYGYDQMQKLGADDMAAIVKSPRYVGGAIDWGAAHLHPLRFAIGLARAAVAAGAQIFETTPVQRVDTTGPTPVVHNDKGRVTAQHVIHATNGYHSGLNRHQAAKVMPLNNYLVATAPLDNPAEVLARDIAVFDNRFVLNYYRLSHDNRLIFGGGESYGAQFPRDIFAKVRRPLLHLFPQLRGVELTHAWGGTLGITPTRLPYFAHVGQNQLAACGYSGHGVAMATFAGQVLAHTITGQQGKFDVLSQLPVPNFPGGPALRAPLMTLAMTWFALRDKLGI